MICAARGCGFMFSIIIPTNDSERALVPTLAALVPGATAGIVREVIVTDGGSRDQTEQVADIAGCRFLSSTAPRGIRLKAAADAARGDWLMFLKPGLVPGPTWIDETIAFTDAAGDRPRAAAFRRESGLLQRTLSLLVLSDAGSLIIAKSFYGEHGHRDAADPERDLLRRIGRRRLVTLRATATTANI
jgi:glycosyltransferase involved in cell wall biosynthesis